MQNRKSKSDNEINDTKNESRIHTERTKWQDRK